MIDFYTVFCFFRHESQVLCPLEAIADRFIAGEHFKFLYPDQFQALDHFDDRVMALNGTHLEQALKKSVAVHDIGYKERPRYVSLHVPTAWNYFGRLESIPFSVVVFLQLPNENYVFFQKSDKLPGWERAGGRLYTGCSGLVDALNYKDKNPFYETAGKEIGEEAGPIEIFDLQMHGVIPSFWPNPAGYIAIFTGKTSADFQQIQEIGEASRARYGELADMDSIKRYHRLLSEGLAPDAYEHMDEMEVEMGPQVMLQKQQGRGVQVIINGQIYDATVPTAGGLATLNRHHPDFDQLIMLPPNYTPDRSRDEPPIVGVSTPTLRSHLLPLT